MNKTKIATTTTFLILMLLVASPVYALAVSVTTDKVTYAPGQKLTVSGTVSPVTAGQDVSILVYDPVGKLKAVDQVTPSSTGAYSKDVMVFSSDDATGVWTVKATYQGMSNTASFSFVGEPVRTKIVLSVQADTGLLRFGGEIVDFYVLTSSPSGVAVDSNVTATLYRPDGVGVVITATRVAEGLYKATYTLPTAATAGTYAVVVKATIRSTDYEGSGTTIKSFQVSDSLTAWNAWLTDIKGDVATVKTDVGTVKLDVAAIKPVVTKVDGDVATIKTDVGTIKTDVKTANTAIAAAKTSADGAKAAVDGMTSVLYAAVVLALIAAAASVFSVIQITRKIAG